MRRLPFVARLLLVPCLALVNMPSSNAQILNGAGYSTITLGTTPLPSGATVTSLAGLTLTSPTLTTPALGVATATSVAIGGATIGSDALAVTGTSTFSSSIRMSAGTAGLA